MNNKSVLVIETPENCYKCPLHRHVNTSKRCMGNMRQYEDHNIVQSWCPLRLLPKEKNIQNGSVNDFYDLGRAVGWNDCLDAITGETK